MERPKPNNIAWGILISEVILYDYLAPPSQTLSEAVDVALDRHPVITTLAIGVTALHLLNVFEQVGLQRLDPIHLIAGRIRHE